MPRGTKFTAEEIGKMNAYKNCGWSNRAIAKEIHRSHIGVAKVLKLGSKYVSKVRSGRPPVITDRQKRAIIHEASTKNLSASAIR